MSPWMGIGVLFLLTGCGVETAGTAAVGASLKAQEAEQAKQMQQDVRRQLDASLQLQQQRLNEASETVGN